MARLTGFQTAETNEVQTANASTSIKRGNSPFQHNVQFTISGFSYEKAEMDGKVSKDAYLNPVLTTSVGSLFLSTVLRSRVKADGTVITPNGTFNKFCREQIAAHKKRKQRRQDHPPAERERAAHAVRCSLRQRDEQNERRKKRKRLE